MERILWTCPRCARQYSIPPVDPLPQLCPVCNPAEASRKMPRGENLDSHVYVQEQDISYANSSSRKRSKTAWWILSFLWGAVISTGIVIVLRHQPPHSNVVATNRPATNGHSELNKTERSILSPDPDSFEVSAAAIGPEIAQISSESKKSRQVPEIRVTPQYPPAKDAQMPSAKVEETRIDGNLSGKISHGSILRTKSGGIYEVVEYVYLYEYEYNPTVVIVPNGEYFKLIVEGVSKPLLCRKLSGETLIDTKTPASIQSRIVSDFAGFEPGNIYRLENSQIWEQTEVRLRISIKIYPEVVIYQSAGGYKMLVNDIGESVGVRRIR